MLAKEPTLVAAWKATEILCVHKGVVMQMWVDMASPNFKEREWRQLPDSIEAAAEYKCYKCVLADSVETITV